MHQPTITTDDGKTRQHITALLKQLEKFFDEKQISDEERFRIGNRLGEAINTELLLRIGDRLTEAQKKEFISVLSPILKSGSDNSGALQRFFDKKFSERDTSHIFEEAIETVLEEFVQKIQA